MNQSLGNGLKYPLVQQAIWILYPPVYQVIWINPLEIRGSIRNKLKGSKERKEKEMEAQQNALEK